MIQMFWEECKEVTFHKQICQPDNFMYLNDKNVIHPHVVEIVWKEVEKDETNFDKMMKKLQEIISVCLFNSLSWGLYLYHKKTYQTQKIISSEIQGLEGQKEVFS